MATVELKDDLARGVCYLSEVGAVLNKGGATTALDAFAKTAGAMASYANHARIAGELPSPSRVRPLLFMALLGKASQSYRSLNLLESILRQAFARSKIDRGLNVVPDYGELMEHLGVSPGCLTLPEIAGLARMTEIAVRNALNVVDPPFSVKKIDGLLSASIEDVRPWLEKRRAYAATQVEEPELESSTTIRVPLARDGSFFSAGCKSKSGYRVGEKGAEVSFDDAYEALRYLEKMAKAKWRRPNPKGIHGIVSAIDWISVPVSKFEETK